LAWLTLQNVLTGSEYRWVGETVR